VIAPAKAASLPPGDAAFLCDLVRERSAIVLESGKDYLFELRLAGLAKSSGFSSLSELVAALRGRRDERLLQRVTELMTTNETSFFRDVHPFDTLKKLVLPPLFRARGKEPVRIWCAASSTGQEIYSVAMLLAELGFVPPAYSPRLLATDLSSEMVERCKAGTFSMLEVNRGLPAQLLVKYFRPQGLDFQIRDDLRALVECRALNLAAPWPSQPPFDVILLRNVLIYFDVATKRHILERMRAALRPEGLLFLGAAETTLNVTTGFKTIQLGRSYCYQPA
jgi:chemotaxis protein methyltransferase CheR